MWPNTRISAVQVGPDSTPFAIHGSKWSREMSANFPNLELLAVPLLSVVEG
jgi:hypothetical protein